MSEVHLGEDLDFYGSVLGSTSLDIVSFEILINLELIIYFVTQLTNVIILMSI